ncbi:transposase [Amycolatopsis sp. NPDC052450]|uniref:transposase n=1 Tax=Amycolatopsis sp. NPDC052450 TaxID=3363937 RepID=UPI0037C96E64
MFATTVLHEVPYGLHRGTTAGLWGQKRLGVRPAVLRMWTCVVHLIRASMRFVSLDDRKAVAKGLKPIYEAVNEAGAQAALNELKHNWGQKYSGLISTWERSWQEFIPFLEFHPAIRKVIYTTSSAPDLSGEEEGATGPVGPVVAPVEHDRHPGGSQTTVDHRVLHRRRVAHSHVVTDGYKIEVVTGRVW